MDDTKVDWTKRIDMPAPAPAPADASHAGAEQPGSGPSGEDRVAQLERNCRRMRVLMGVLAGVVVVLAAATIAMGVVLPSKIDEQESAIAALEQAQESAGESDAGSLENESESQDGGGVFGSIGSGAQSGSDGGFSSGSIEGEEDEPGVYDADGNRVTAADLTGIINEKWSNALRILESYGIDPNDLVIVTDDGGAVFDAGNWTVTMVADLDDSGQIAVYLRHDIDWF